MQRHQKAGAYHEVVGCSEILCGITDTNNSIQVADALYGFLIMGAAGYQNNYFIVTSIRKMNHETFQTSTDFLDIIKIEGYKY